MPDVNMSLYEVNKSIMAKKSPMKVNEAKNTLKEFINNIKNNYYMMLCKELSYYTLFHINNLSTEKIEDIVIEIATDYGVFYSADVYEDHVEIWVKMKITGECHMFMFFPYDMGVIECQ